jgi:DNA-binding NtrC family response regulator
MRQGAFHFIEKPFEIPLFTERVCMALDTINLAIENRNLRRALESRYVFTEIIGTSRPLLGAVDLALRASDQSSPVLLLGQSGTGKDLFARAIHFHSPRRSKPFIPINCGAIPENLIESEFFGHTKGSFTGAVANRLGCFEAVAGGTLFLDEIGEMPLDMQVRLLRVLEEHKIRRIGENREIPVDFRIIAATNRSLRDLVQRKEFRQDLYYRLNVLTIHLPSLKERPEDVVPLTETLLAKARDKGETRVRFVSPAAMELLQAYEYPGNVRELINILQRALLLCDGDRLEPQHLPPEVHGHVHDHDAPPEEDGLNLKLALHKATRQIERRLIAKALEQANGNHKKAAEILGISRGSFYNKLNDTDQ